MNYNWTIGHIYCPNKGFSIAVDGRTQDLAQIRSWIVQHQQAIAVLWPSIHELEAHIKAMKENGVDPADMEEHKYDLRELHDERKELSRKLTVCNGLEAKLRPEWQPPK